MGKKSRWQDVATFIATEIFQRQSDPLCQMLAVCMDDLGLVPILADFLEERGDPRGEKLRKKAPKEAWQLFTLFQEELSASFFAGGKEGISVGSLDI
jgi:hypothetical protein